MARLARVVVAGMPHHVTQRGNRRQATFFCDDDYQAYLDVMAEWCGEHNIEVWAYCLMPNHVHLIVVPHLRRTQPGPRAAGNGAERVSLEQRLRAHQAEG